MLQFILTDVLLLSVGTVLYLTVRALPRLEEFTEGARRTRWWDRVFASDVPHRLDAVVNHFLGKFFRKLKIHLMRLDNYLTVRLKKLTNETNGNGKGKNGKHTEYLKELTGPLERTVEREDNTK